MKALRIGTRESALALWQAEHVRRKMQELHGLECEIIRIKTSGDHLQSAPVGQMGLKGIFLKEIEEALLEGRVDLAVHSLKDVPTETPRGLVFPAYTRREDARDCLISRSGRTLAELPAGSLVGTSSVRRQAQLRFHRKDLRVADLRGNVDTRLRKLDAGEFDAIVVAKAGVERLSLAQRITEVLSLEVMLPAVGQGALAIECRASDAALVRQLAALNDGETRACVAAERALLAELQGGCQLPLGAYARIENGLLFLKACVLAADGSDRVSESIEGKPEDAEKMGRKLGQSLLEAGADRILRLAGRTVGQ